MLFWTPPSPAMSWRDHADWLARTQRAAEPSFGLERSWPTNSVTRARAESEELVELVVRRFFRGGDALTHSDAK